MALILTFSYMYLTMLETLLKVERMAATSRSSFISNACYCLTDTQGDLLMDILLSWTPNTRKELLTISSLPGRTDIITDREMRDDVYSPDLHIKIVSCYFTLFKIK